MDLAGEIDLEDPVPIVRTILDRVTEMILSFKEISKLFIAAVNGPAMGLGFGIVLASDISIASERAFFSTPFVLRGLHPDTATTYFLPRVVGLSRARDLLLTGKNINAEEAGRLGIVNKVVSPDQLQSEVERMAMDWARGPLVALGMTKTSIYKMLDIDLASALELEARAQYVCVATEDVKEAFRAWKEKKPPIFRGK
jgi:2-(1,2-epoxy-1,2-dihydrophenyl)acetyl-CoA isomerase